VASKVKPAELLSFYVLLSMLDVCTFQILIKLQNNLKQESMLSVKLVTVVYFIFVYFL
jgi:hypothetical protein